MCDTCVFFALVFRSFCIIHILSVNNIDVCVRVYVVSISQVNVNISCVFYLFLV